MATTKEFQSNIKIDGGLELTGNMNVGGDLNVVGFSGSGLQGYHSTSQNINANPVLFNTRLEFGANQNLISYSSGDFTFDVAGTYEIKISFHVFAGGLGNDAYVAKVDWRTTGGSLQSSKSYSWNTTTNGSREITLNYIETVTASTVRRVVCTRTGGAPSATSIPGGTPGNGVGVRMNIIIKRL